MCTFVWCLRSPVAATRTPSDASVVRCTICFLAEVPEEPYVQSLSGRLSSQSLPQRTRPPEAAPSRLQTC